jgi:hypothetical protein
MNQSDNKYIYNLISNALLFYDDNKKINILKYLKNNNDRIIYDDKIIIKNKDNNIIL